MDLNLKGKKVLVTGSSRGIGKAIAEAFLKEGSQVLITGRDFKNLEETRKALSKISPQVVSQECDFTQETQVTKLADWVSKNWKGLDVLVANVGSGRSAGEAIPSHQNYRNHFEQNYESAQNAARSFYTLLKKNKGNIVFVNSIAGLESLAPVDYSTAKAALLTFAKHLSRSAASDGVRVNSIAPGHIHFAGGSWDEKLKKEPARVKKLIADTVPLGRFGNPSEIADSVVFISSDRASYMTGACLVVDGGITDG